MIELSDYQVEASERMQAYTRWILGDEPGVGKSYPALDAAMKSGKLSQGCLLVCPAHLQEQWKEYIVEYTGCPPGNVSIVTGTPKQRKAALKRKALWTIISYAMLARTIPRIKYSKKSQKKPRKTPASYPEIQERWWGVVIFDEAHYMRGRNSHSTNAAQKLTASRKWMLTGTPLVSNAGDIFPLLKIIDPKTFSSYWKFVERWCHIEENPWSRKPRGVKDPEAFYEMLQSYMLRRSPQDVGLPIDKPVLYELRVNLPPSVKQMHDRAKEDYFIKHPDLDKPEAVTGAGALISKLRQLVSVPPTKANPKLDALKGVLEDFPNEPAIVFTWYKKSRDYLTEQLTSKRGRPVFKVDGGPSKMHAIVDAWKHTKDGILIANIAAIETGANLQNSSLVIFYEQDWVSATNEQAIARANRRGQTRPVRVYRIIARACVDAHVHTVVKRRARDVTRALLEELRSY